MLLERAEDVVTQIRGVQSFVLSAAEGHLALKTNRAHLTIC